MSDLVAPFPYFGGKREIATVIWERLGSPLQYIEPFFGSGAVLLAAPKPANLEVVNDVNGFLANFWRATKHQPAEVARAADYPVSHVDLGARHVWLMQQRARLADGLQDPNWTGDAQVAGWWLWGQCAWIGSGWCEWGAQGQIPHASSAGQGVQALGKIPHASDAGRGVQALGQIPHASSAGQGDLMTSTGRTAWDWLHRLAARLERVRIVHGSWERCLNNHYGDLSTALFLDPPYLAFEKLYGGAPVAREVETWSREHAELRIALCGHVNDYTLEEWTCVRWKRPRLTYNGSATTDLEAIWFSPACLKPINERKGQTLDMFAAAE